MGYCDTDIICEPFSDTNSLRNYFIPTTFTNQAYTRAGRWQARISRKTTIGTDE